MKRIIIPVDLSPENLQVLPLLQVMKNKGVEFVFVHIWQNSYWGKQADLKKSHKELLESLQGRQELEGLEVKILWHESNQSPGIALSQIIEQEQADLVVLAIKQKDTLDRMILGTESTRIIQNCRVPMLIVPRKLFKVSFENATFFTDASPESLPGFQKILPVLSFLGTSWNVVKINTPSDFMSQREWQAYQNAFKELIPFQCSFDMYCSYEVEKGVLEYTIDNEKDLIVMLTHGRKGLSLMLNGSVTEEIIAASFKPMLIGRL